MADSVLAGGIETEAELDEVIANLEAALANLRARRARGEEVGKIRRPINLTGRRVSVPGSGELPASFGLGDFGFPSSGPNGSGGGG